MAVETLCSSRLSWAPASRISSFRRARGRKAASVSLVESVNGSPALSSRSISLASGLSGSFR